MNANNAPLSPYRLLLAAAIPFLALALQSFFWAAIQPYVWFLFFPAVFFSSWVAGFYGGMAATLISTLLAWWYFIPPTHSFSLDSPNTLFSIAMFAFMGLLFSISHGRLRKANQSAAEALASARSANDEITRLFEKTKELDALKTQFFANVSHELRTPLTLILGPVSKILEMKGLDEGLRRDMELVERNARQLYRHMSDLLDVAKLEAGRAVVRYSSADLAQLVRLIASNFESLSVERRIRVNLEAEGSLQAHVDEEKFQRIVLNLLSNAFKFTPSGGTITLGLRKEGTCAVFQISDDGPGIPENMRDAVFERFRQVEGGAQRRFGGTGLGLAIVKEFVELHNGTIAISAAPTGGAVFTVTLPLVAPDGAVVHGDPAALDKKLEHQALDELSARPDAAGPGAADDAPLVLVVEDNRDMSAYIRKILTPHHRVVSAFDGEEGLAKALESRPALIISDIMMPRMSGDEMVGELRLRPETSGTPVVMLTAKTDEAMRVGLLKNGAQDFLAKPFNEAELLAVVGRLIAERRAVETERASMRIENARLAAAVASAGEGIVITDAEGAIVYMNPVYEEITGYSLAEARGRTPRIIKSGSHDRGYYDELWKTIKAGRVWRGHVVNRKKDGSLYEEEMTVSPVVGPDGKIANYVAVKHDVTRETALRKARDYFTVVTSHELRTPLNTLHLVDKILRLNEAACDPAQLSTARNSLDDAMKAIDRMVEATTMILELTDSHEKKRLAPELVRSIMGMVLENTRDNIAGEKRRVIIEADLTKVPERAVILANGGMVRMALDELLSNAVKFTPDDKKVYVRAGLLGAAVKIEVADEGAGIPGDRLAEVTVPYFSLENPLLHSTGRHKFQGGGLGLGLTIAKLVMEYHDGSIAIGNRSDGTGTLVTLTFPLAKTG